MSNVQILRAYLKEAKYECIRALRSPGFAVPFLVLPAALYLLMGVVLFADAAKQDPNAPVFFFTGFATFGVMGPGMFGFGIFVALEREQGLLTLKRALPMPPAAYLVAKMSMAVLFTAIVMATMIASAAGVAHLRLTGTQFLMVAAIYVLGALPFCAIGLFIGTRASGKAAPALVNLLYLPMIYLSGILIPMPKSLQWIARASPASYLDVLALRAAGGPAIGPAPIVDVAVLFGVTVVLMMLSVRRLVRVG
jgi:ABC-2 type transport system permease protein